MGLDVYVGTLTRYYIGDWDAVVAPGGRTADDTMILRIADNGHETPDPVQVRQDVLKWRDWMNQEVDLLQGPLDWPEQRDVPYYTDKPTWDALAALLLWAAYSEHPGLPRPDRLPEEGWTDDPAFQASLDEEFESRYPHLLFGVDLWLPVRTGGVFDAPDAMGEDRRFGSVFELLEELEDLNRRFWGADADTLEAWRDQGLDPDRRLEPLARFALAVCLPLARQAAEFGLPMLLDE